MSLSITQKGDDVKLREVFEMIEPEIKEILDDHGGRIGKLETDSEVFKEKFNNISSQLTRIENNALASNNALLASNNSVLSTLNKVIESNTTHDSNNTEIITTKSNNTKEIALKILAIFGGLITAYFAIKGINITI